MPKYKISKRAEKDLADIWRYTVNNWSREQADKYATGILAVMEEISKAPVSVGCTYEHVRKGYRKYQWGKHVIFHIAQNDGSVFISRILHEIMDFERHL